MRQDDFSLYREPNAEAMDAALEIYAPCKDFTGNYVCHCHILDHEDQGMMPLVQGCNAKGEREPRARPASERSMSKRLTLIGFLIT